MPADPAEPARGSPALLAAAACGWLAVVHAIAELSACVLVLGVLEPGDGNTAALLWVPVVAWGGAAALHLFGARAIARGRPHAGVGLILRAGLPATLPGLPFVLGVVDLLTNGKIGTPPRGTVTPAFAVFASAALLAPLGLSAVAAGTLLVHRARLRASEPAGRRRILTAASRSSVLVPLLLAAWAWEVGVRRYDGRTARAWVDRLQDSGLREREAEAIRSLGADALPLLLAAFEGRPTLRWRIRLAAESCGNVIELGLPSPMRWLRFRALPFFQTALRGLVALGPAAVPAVEEMLGRPGPLPGLARGMHRQLVARLAEDAATRAALEAALARLARSPHVEIRERAADVLPAFRGHAGLLLDLLLQDPEFSVRLHALEAASYLPEHRVPLKLLLAASANTNSDIRAAAAQLLAWHNLKEAEGRAAVATLLADSVWLVRFKALEGLSMAISSEDTLLPEATELLPAVEAILCGPSPAEADSAVYVAIALGATDAELVSRLLAHRAAASAPDPIDDVLLGLGGRALPPLAAAYGGADPATKEAIRGIVKDVGREAAAEDPPPDFAAFQATREARAALREAYEAGRRR